MKEKMWKNDNLLLREAETGKFVSSYFVCGPGKVTAYYTNDYEESEPVEEDGFDYKLANEVEGFIYNDDCDCNEDLAQYYNGDGVKSITFEQLCKRKGKYYMMWKVIWSPEVVGDVEKIKDFLAGQMSDGWGESFEQHEFFKEVDYITDEFEDYDDLDEYGNPIAKMMYDVRTEISYYYSPWSNNHYEVIDEGCDSYEEKVKRHRKRV